MQKILIANRGECALRIQRTLSKMGFFTVMVFSEEDRQSKHISAGDLAYSLGSGPSALTYLNQERLLEIADHSGCFAIHPGYGFLAENAPFASACIQRGMQWIGPAPQMIELFGDKIAARKAMKDRDVPILPGTMDPIKDLSELKNIFLSFEGPALLKAAGGGGGKGMRIVNDPNQLEEQFLQCSNEAQKAFGDPRVFLEKYVEKGRHIEIQILGDKFGQVCHFGARECSVQRRHQKVLEESPVANVEQIALEELIQTVVKASSDLGYDSLGTYEFLLAPEGDFYFLETNTRLQVEHSVTEMTYNIDLVEHQVRSALNRRLDEDIINLKPSGWAMEARIYAEDPRNKFAPSPGLIEFLQTPHDEDIRVDSYLDEGGTVPMFFDPMIAKVTALGSNRHGVILKLRRFLTNYIFGGITTNISFHLWLLIQQNFLDSEIETSYLDQNIDEVQNTLLQSSEYHKNIAVGVAYLLGEPHSVYETLGLFVVMGGEPQTFNLRHYGNSDDVRKITLKSGEKELCQLEILKSSEDSFIAIVDNKPIQGIFKLRGNEASVGFYGEVHKVELYHPGCRPLSFLKPRPKISDGEIFSPIQGMLTRIQLACGDHVKTGDLLMVVEAMKMENEIRSPLDGSIQWIGKGPGNSVGAGELLMRIEKDH